MYADQPGGGTCNTPALAEGDRAHYCTARAFKTLERSCFCANVGCSSGLSRLTGKQTALKKALDQAAIDLNSGTGDIPGLVRGQERNESAEFLRMTNSSQRNILCQIAQGFLLCQSSGQVSLDA